MGDSMTFIIGINERGWMEVRVRRGDKIRSHVVRTRKAITRVIQRYVDKYNLKEDDIMIMRSSSVDFPEESTDKASVISLARSLW